MQQLFLHKYSFQRVPNQVEKLRKFQEVGGGKGGYDKPPGMEIPAGWEV